MAWELIFKPLSVSIYEANYISKHYAYAKNSHNDWKHFRKNGRENLLSFLKECSSTIFFTRTQKKEEEKSALQKPEGGKTKLLDTERLD